MTRQLTHTTVSPPPALAQPQNIAVTITVAAGTTTGDSTATDGTETIHQHADIDVCIVAHLFCCLTPPAPAQPQNIAVAITVAAGTATGDSTVTYSTGMIHTKTSILMSAFRQTMATTNIATSPSTSAATSGDMHPSLPWCCTIDSTATGDDGSNTLATMLSTLSPLYPHPSVWTLCH